MPDRLRTWHFEFDAFEKSAHFAFTRLLPEKLASCPQGSIKYFYNGFRRHRSLFDAE
jgi:hypothetical protein